MKQAQAIWGVMILVVVTVFASAIFAQDDHPLVSRYAGATLQKKETEESAEYKLVTGRTAAGEFVGETLLLQERAALKLFVVGHTDMTASLEHNRTLSSARAQVVVKALVTNHGIAAARLEGHGVGPLAPAASNANAEGRARNRRVELVAR